MFKNLSFFSFEGIVFIVSLSIFDILNGSKKTNSLGLLEVDLVSLINGLSIRGLFAAASKFVADLIGITKFCPTFKPSLRIAKLAFWMSSTDIEYNFEMLKSLQKYFFAESGALKKSKTLKS